MPGWRAPRTTQHATNQPTNPTATCRLTAVVSPRLTISRPQVPTKASRYSSHLGLSNERCVSCLQPDRSMGGSALRQKQWAITCRPAALCACWAQQQPKPSLPPRHPSPVEGDVDAQAAADEEEGCAPPQGGPGEGPGGRQAQQVQAHDGAGGLRAGRRGREGRLGSMGLHSNGTKAAGDGEAEAAVASAGAAYKRGSCTNARRRGIAAPTSGGRGGAGLKPP